MKARTLILLLAALGSTSAFAQDAADASMAQPETNPAILFIIYFIVAAMLFVLFSLYRINGHLKKFFRGEFESEEQKMYDSRSFWEKTFQLKPVGTDKDTMINEAHDGIYELDNPPPPWFMFLFYGTILFAVIYFVRFEITGDGPRQEAEYAAEVKEAEAAQTARLAKEEMGIDESNVELLTADVDINKGMEIYETNCKVCHDEGGKGNTGPNLTDQYWKHGGGIQNIFKTIKYGVIEKGMRSWKTDLTPKMMQQVSSYIISLEGTNPEGAKAPEGDLWVPEEKTTPEATDSTATDSLPQVTEQQELVSK